jgi:dienelactone hydrolase
MGLGWYGRWMTRWETDLTTRDTNRIVRPLELGFDWLADFGGDGGGMPGAKAPLFPMTGYRGLKPAATPAGTGVSAVAEEDGGPAQGARVSDIERMIALNEEIAGRSDEFFGYTTPADFRLEERHPELFPTNVRPETLAQDAEMKRAAEAGELEPAQFLRFTSAVRTPYPENDQVNARWYPAPAEKQKSGRPKQALIVMPQWNADALSHNVFGTMANWFGVSALRMSKPYHDIRRPAELERSDYAMSANIGRTISSCRQAVADIRSCMDWLETQGYTQFGVLGTSLGSCYAFITAAHDPRLRVCAFNHASTWFGDVVWEGQSTRHVRAGFEQAGLTQDQVRRLFLSISPMTYMDRFAATPKRSLVVHATYDLTFPLHLSLDVLKNFRRMGVDYVSKVLPCGHYTSGETPYKYMVGWYVGSFIRSAFKDLAERG